MASGPATFAVFTSLRYDLIFESLAENKALPAEFPKQFFLLDYHRERLLHSVSYFQQHGTASEGAGKWDSTLSLLKDTNRFSQLVKEGVEAHIIKFRSHGPFRVRVILSPPPSQDLLRVECNDTLPLALSALAPTTIPLPGGDDTPESPKWTVHLDTLPTVPSPLTSYKTILRDHYNSSRERCGLPELAVPGASNEVVLYNPEGELMEGSFTSVYFFRGGIWVTPPLGSGGCEATMRRWLLERGQIVERIITKDELKKGEWVVMSNAVRGVWGGWLT